MRESHDTRHVKLCWRLLCLSHEERRVSVRVFWAAVELSYRCVPRVVPLIWRRNKVVERVKVERGTSRRPNIIAHNMRPPRLRCASLRKVRDLVLGQNISRSQSSAISRDGSNSIFAPRNVWNGCARNCAREWNLGAIPGTRER